MIFCLFIPYVIAQFSVKQPIKYAQENLTLNIANYGYVPYGQQLWGSLALAQPMDYCEKLFLPLHPHFEGEESQVQILVTRRGNCTFLQKSKNAQESGYVMLVIVDSKEEDVNSFEMISKDPSVEIRIPVIMINHDDGEQLIKNMEQALMEDQQLTASIKFPLYFKGKTVQYQYWFSVMDKASYEFLDQFYPFHQQMASQLNFTPHYQLIKSSYAEHQNFTVQDSSCLSGGRYCAPDPDGSGPLSGQDAVVQVLKQLCIWQIDQQKWWKYVIKYQQTCLSSYTDMLFCEEQAAEFAGLSYKQVLQCFNNSFADKDMTLSDSDILKREFISHLQYSIFSWPELMVNDQRYKGSLYLDKYKLNVSTGVQDLFDTTHYGPLQMICRSFEEEVMPKICQEKIIGYIVDGQIIKHQAGQSTWIVWVCAIFVMTVLMAVTMWLFKRNQRKEQQQIIQENGNIYISQYYALKEKEGQSQ